MPYARNVKKADRSRAADKHNLGTIRGRLDVTSNTLWYQKMFADTV